MLRQHGLWVGVWPRRLANASPRLIRFVNRHYRTAGFQHVVRDLYAGGYRREVARLAMRLAERLALRRPGTWQRLSFGQTLSIAPGGHPVRVVEVWVGRVRYQLKPWSRLDPQAVRRQLRRDRALFGPASALRWVFDGRRLGMRREDIVDELRYTWGGAPDRRGLPDPGRLVVVV